MVGFVDDVRGLSPPSKVAGTVLAGLALVQFGVVMYAFRLPFFDGPILLAAEWRPLVTVLWLLGMTQAINLIDGLDGLAAGIVAIGAGAFFLYSQELIDSDAATARIDQPYATRAIARSRRSFEKGRVIHASLHPGMDSESDQSRFGNPKSIPSNLILLYRQLTRCGARAVREARQYP